MNTKESNEVFQTLQEAQAYLGKLTRDVNMKPDFPRLHRYLTVLTPHLHDAAVPAALLGTVAQLYFESMQYAASAEILLQYNDPGFNEMRVNNDFFNAYYVTSFDWETRVKSIWNIFSSLEKGLFRGKDEANLLALRMQLDPYFPADEVLPTPPLTGSKALLYLGNPHGILSLVPMLYLAKHAPGTVSRRWDVCLAPDERYVSELAIGDKMVPTSEIQVRIVPSTSGLPFKVDLQLWHPALEAIARAQSGEAAADWARLLAAQVIPPAAYALHVGAVSAGKALASEETVPLTELPLWLLDHNMDPDVPLQSLLEQRRYAFTRTPANVSRPRADITRGETCLPELEEIYFLRNSKSMAALQRYGVGYWFLTIPKKVCGEDFQAFRQKLQAGIRSTQGDLVYFTGWAEGTQNCYIDFLSLGSGSVLSALNKYCNGLPGGRDIRICSFYWNSVLRTPDYAAEMGKFAKTAAKALFGVLKPPKDLTTPEERAALEKAFRETRWTDLKGNAAQGSSQDEQVDLETLRRQLQKAIQCVMEWDYTGKPYDYFFLHTVLDNALSKVAHLDVDEDFCDAMSSVLMAADRFREAAAWKSRVSPSEEKTTFLYSCDIASDYPMGQHTWESRRQALYKYLSGVEFSLAKALSNRQDQKPVVDFMLQLELACPVTELSMLPSAAGRKNTILTGLPDGILTLPAMEYFCSHRPAGIGKRWTIAISQAGSAPDTLEGVSVSLTEKGGKVSLAVWNKALAELPEGQDRDATAIAIAAQLVNEALPMGARLLYVDEITAVEEEPADAFPMAELQQQMQARGYRTDISLDTLLSRRRYAITRAPKDTDRPRDDILRGETCMPELERIYSHLYDAGQSILEQYGLYAAFLMIPNDLCGGDPAQYREQLQRRISQAEGDKVFFTGWAEGTKYCYLDFISMDGQSLLNTLNEYAIGNHGGSWLRLCGFFWRSTPRSWLRHTANEQMRSETHEGFAAFARAHTVPDFPVPDAKAAAAFEASFQPMFTPEDL